MELKVSVSEAIALIKEVENVQAKILEYIGMNIQKEVGAFLTNLIDKELTDHVGREKYERKEGCSDYPNGSYIRTFCIKGIGDVEVKVPRDRDGDFQTRVLPKNKQYDERITEDIAAMYLTGISTRTLSLLSKRLIGRSLSPAEVSNESTELKHAVETWRNRDLSGETIKYLFLDGVNFRMRITDGIKLVPVLVAISVRETGQNWFSLFRAVIKNRHLPGENSSRISRKEGLTDQRSGSGSWTDLPVWRRYLKKSFSMQKFSGARSMLPEM